MKDPTDLLAEEHTQALRESLGHAKRSRGTEVLSWVLSDHRGRAFVWSLLEQAGVFQQPFASDPGLTAFNCGRKNIGLKLLADVMGTSPDAFGQMMKEHENYERSLADIQYGNE